MDIYSSFNEGNKSHLRAMEDAMVNAVTDMEYEGTLQVMKRILALRTHLDERGMNAEMPLQLIFKMAFAREQGLDVEEIYDPIVFGDLTDSQLAANNFVADMQRSFHIDFPDDVIASIRTIKDLVKAVVTARSSE